MSEIAENLAHVVALIGDACIRVGRNAKDVSLIAVSKTFPVNAIREAAEVGQSIFGESKLQEAEAKIAALPANLHWHFIGRVQRNKLRKILQSFEVVHAIDSARLAKAVDELAEELGLFPKIFLQVNIGQEESKGGFSPDELVASMEGLLFRKRLEIQGLMCIPRADPDPEAARPWFVALRELRDSLEASFGACLPELSMGMSDDYVVAVEEGATHVRVGSAIFGKRSHRVDGELG